MATVSFRATITIYLLQHITDIWLLWMTDKLKPMLLWRDLGESFKVFQNRAIVTLLKILAYSLSREKIYAEM